MAIVIGRVMALMSGLVCLLRGAHSRHLRRRSWGICLSYFTCVDEACCQQLVSVMDAWPFSGVVLIALQLVKPIDGLYYLLSLTSLD